MKRKHNLAIGLIALNSAVLFAGEENVLTPASTPSGPDFMDKINFTGDFRARYEFRDEETFNASNALTVRGRLGLKIGEFNGFSAFIEGEGTHAFVDDFASNPLPGALQSVGGRPNEGLTDPYEFGNTFIGDPNNYEINQAFLRYAKHGFSATLGRQRIIRNNAAMVGNVVWRQNEQTFDAIELAYTKDDFAISYAYADRVQRIFGVTAPNAHPLRDFEGDFHFFDVSGKTSIGKVGGYAYLLDIDVSQSFPTFPVNSIGDTNTFGLFWENNGFYAEFAYQDGDAPIRPNINGDYDAVYGHFKYSTKVGGLPVNMGIEYLGDGFVTPLATVHAFNGFADSFIFNRIGLPFGNSNYEGLTDFYSDITRTGLPGGLVFKGFLHYFMDAELDASYGWEADMVLIKKINENATAIFKAAYFQADEFFNDITQVSLQVDYRF
jgi:hypothetical protein